MKFTLAWLKDHLDTTADAACIAETLTTIGLEVESVEDRAAALKDFIVAEIMEASPHPNASKLQVCKVNDGARVRQIVCGAANARAGLKVVLAREGVHIPGNGMVIKKTAIRGVESDGMLCSAEELGLSEKSAGIIELPASAIPGAPAAAALGANDPVFDLAVTPNRADALGVRGVARDLAAAGLGTLNPLPIPEIPAVTPCPIKIAIETKACPLLIGYYLKGIKNGESPDWLKARLAAIGQKPISALVDITNYFTYGFARPLHVFDAAKISGGLTVREAHAGEKLAALNGKDYTLAPGMTIIADANGPLALGGIIGGADSAVGPQTTDVLMEVALFDPVNIARTGRALEILSDARYRFERGVDPGFAADGGKLAVKMILELCGGAASAPVVAGVAPAWKRSIHFNPSRVAQLGGVGISNKETLHILHELGFEGKAEGEALRVTPPSFRQDVEGEADVVEEILRIHGYAHIPSTPLPRADDAAPARPVAQKCAALAKYLLTSRGLSEIVSFSFVPRALAAQFGAAQPILLQNPISAELDAMRPSLLPNLLAAARDNGHRGARDLALFEAGPQFSGTAPEQQHAAASGIRTGGVAQHMYENGNFHAGTREADCFDAKADALALLAALGVKAESLVAMPAAPAWYHPGRSGALALGKTVLGYFGEIHPGIAAQFDLGRVAAFEILLDTLPAPKSKGKAKPVLKVSDFQAVLRDFAFVCDTGVGAAEIIKVLSGADALITEVRLFDVYSGKGVETGKKSVAVGVTLQALDRTLSEEEINKVSNAVIAAAQKFGGMLRQ